MERKMKDRRGFLAGAGKYGVWLMGAAYVIDAADAAGLAPSQRRNSEVGDTPPSEDGMMPVAEKDMMRVLGIANRRPGLTRQEAYGADTPHIVPSYYASAYTKLTKVVPGRNARCVINAVTDSAFGGDRRPPFGPHHLHVDVPPDEMDATSLTNVDVVSEVSYQMPGQGVGGTGWAKNLPRWVENGTEMVMGVKQVFAFGTRPDPIGGDAKAMFFLKLAPSVAPADRVKTWQTLHDRAVKENQPMANGLHGYEILERLPEMPAKQPNKYTKEMTVPDLVVVYWRKDGLRPFPGYARSFRRLDTENWLDLPNSFFLLVNEFEYD